MRKIRTLIVDDELPARQRLTDLLEKEPDIEISGAARDGPDAVEQILRLRPDLLFLDIQMPGRDGFSVLEDVGPQAMPVTIFVTAYDRYAIRAFEAHALDYLLKPFADERFEAALARARDHIGARRGHDLGERLAQLLGDRESMDRLVIKSSGRVTFLEVREIDWIEAAGVYVNLHVAGKTYLYRSTLGSLHKRLDARKFVRVHRSIVVNANRIRELEVKSHGDHTVMLKDGTELTLSRKYRAELEAWLRQPL